MVGALKHHSALTKVQQPFLFKCSPGGCKLLIRFSSFKKLILTVFASIIVALVEGHNFGVTCSTIVCDVIPGVFVLVPMPVPHFLNNYSFL